MSDPKRQEPAADSQGFTEQVAGKAARKLKARDDPAPVWLGLGMMGLIGWSVVLPTLAGAALGSWLDHRHPSPLPWTLALLTAGLCIGCANAWYWVAKEDRAMRRDRGERDD